MDSIQLFDKIFSRFITSEEIETKVEQMAVRLNSKFKGKEPVILVVMNGGFKFAAHLVDKLEFNPRIEFIKIKTYDGDNSTGKLLEDVEFPANIQNMDVIIIEDIIDTGFTLNFLLDRLQSLEPSSVSIATLLFKPEALKFSIQPDYIGFEIGTEFVVGYGLDYNQMGRHLKHIYKIVE